MKSDDEMMNKYVQAVRRAIENLDALVSDAGPIISFAAAHMAAHSTRTRTRTSTAVAPVGSGPLCTRSCVRSRRYRP